MGHAIFSMLSSLPRHTLQKLPLPALHNHRSAAAMHRSAGAMYRHLATAPRVSEGAAMHRHLAIAPRVSEGRPAILTTPSSPPRRRSVESCGMPPSIRLAGLRSRCTHDILFLLQECTEISQTRTPASYCCMRCHPPIGRAQCRSDLQMLLCGYSPGPGESSLKRA